jgi:hypothetical protein
MVAQTQGPTWLSEARRRIQPIGAITYDAGAGGPRRQNLRNTGYLERIHLVHTLNGTYTTAGPTGVDAWGQYCGAIKRVRVEANGVAPLYDCEGGAVAIISALDRQYRHSSSFSLTPDPYSFTSSPGTSAFADVWALDIPIALDLANKPWPLGLFQTAISSQEVTLTVEFNKAAGSAGNPGTCVYTGNAANLNNETGQVTPHQVFYDPIGPVSAQPPLGFIHQWTSRRWPLTADGDVEIELPVTNLYTRLAWAVVTGASGALALNGTVMTRARLMYGPNLTPYDMTNQQLRAYMSSMYGATMLSGVYVFDFIEDTHTERDWINASATTDLRLVLTLSGGTYSGGAYALLMEEKIIPIGVNRGTGVQG